MSLGERLREERERMGLSQPRFGELLGTTKQTVFAWESGRTAPDGFQLSLAAASGFDVQYIVTGICSDMALTPDERELLALFRSASLSGKAAAIGALQGVAAATPTPKQIAVTGNSNQVAGGNIKNRGERKR